MGLWGKSTSAESRPKFLSTDNNATGAGGARNNAFANTSGWALRPGLAMSGNDNSSAQAEVLVCIRNLSSTMAEANLLSVGWDSNTSLAHDGSGYIDIYFNCDEAITVTSAAYTGDSTETNHWYFTLRALDPDDLSEDAAINMQYYAGSGTNRITFRGVIPAGAQAGAVIALNESGSTAGTCPLVTNGTAAVVDGNGTTCTWADQDLAGGSAGAGVDHSTAVLGTATTAYNSELDETQTLDTVAGDVSGSITTGLVSLACVS
jgi:hypothetical protein